MKHNTQKAKATKSNRVNPVDRKIAKAAAQSADRIAKTTAKLNGYIDANTIATQLARDIVKTYKQVKDINNKKLVSKIYMLARVMVLSKIKHLQEPRVTKNGVDCSTWSVFNEELRKQVIDVSRTDSANAYIDILESISDLFIVKHTKDGDRVVECTDKDQLDRIMKRLSQLANNDGLNIIHEATLPILEVLLSKPVKKLSNDCLLELVDVVVESTTVYRNGQPKDSRMWVHDVSNAVNDVTKCVSDAITREKHVRDTHLGDAYVETTIDGSAYRTYAKVSPLMVSEVRDFNGKIESATADKTIFELNEIVKKHAKLSRQELYIYNNYLMGDMTFEQICDELNITDGSAKKAVFRIKDKIAGYASDIFTPELLVKYGVKDAKKARQDVKKSNNQPKSIVAIEIKTNKSTCYKTLGDASKALGVDKSTISKVLKGKRKSTSGYTFKYNYVA